MEGSHMSPKFKKWMKKCLSDEFSGAIEENLQAGDREPYDVAQKIINSREMTELTHAIRNSFLEQFEASRSGGGGGGTTRPSTAITSAANSRPATSLSFVSELESEEDWPSPGPAATPRGLLNGSQSSSDPESELGRLIEQMGQSRPDHVRLAGYEALLRAEPTGLSACGSWTSLLRALREGLLESGRSVFEASLLLQARLLRCPETEAAAQANLLEGFSELCRPRRLAETPPSLLSGVNFKLLLHEKLFRTMRLLVEQQEETLKSSRAPDRAAEEALERFVSLLGTQEQAGSLSGSAAAAGGAGQKWPLSGLQILGLLEPRAAWSKRWLHGLATRRALCSAIGRSPSFLHAAIGWARRGLESPPRCLSASVVDDPPDVFVSGETVEALGFLHCLHLLSQLAGSATGRQLLADCQPEREKLSVPDLLAGLLSCLDGMAASSAPRGLYDGIRQALAHLLARPLVLYDARFQQLAIQPLLRQPESRIWPHTLDALSHVISSVDGPSFMANGGSENSPLVSLVAYAAKLFRQPLAVLSIEHFTELCSLLAKLFRVHELFGIVEIVVRKNLYPSLAYIYGKLDKYYIENENKTQHLDKSLREMLLSLVSLPLGLQMLSAEPLILEEMIRGSIAPVRASWSAYDVIAFVANSGFLSRGAEVLAKLAPHVLSTLLLELSKALEEPKRFYDPWDSDDVKVFIHVLALFTLNTKCFLAFMTKEDEESKDSEEREYVANLNELFQRFPDVDSPYHQLGLLAIKTLYWNLDIYLYLINLLDFQTKLLEYQNEQRRLNNDDDDPESQPAYIVDECSLLRHSILLSCYYVRPRRSELLLIAPEETRLFATLPPSEPLDDFIPRPTSGSELDLWLSDSGPGLLDNGWVLGTRRAHKASPGPMPNQVLLNLLEQMEKAIPTVEWVDAFKWDPDFKCSDEYWLAEEKCGIDLVIHYSTIYQIMESNDETKNNLKLFIQSSHHFINYKKSTEFEGFDWFLATVFLICDGNVDKAKTFVTQLLHFPAATFMWPALAKVVDENDAEEASTRLLFAHLLESIISLEFPTVKFALKRECGLDWWMICDRLLAQCFWGILPWSEIMHFFAICILHTPDYILYYCASLLNHCEGDVIKSVKKGKMWPEDMVLEDYRCHSQIGFMDRLGKRYGGKVLPSLTQRKLNVTDSLNDAS